MTRILSRATWMLLTVLFSATSAWAQSTFGGGNGSQATPYIIMTADHWNQLSSDVAAGTTYNDQYFRLNDDISVTTMVGTSDHRFQGHFDGNQKTLTFNLNSSEDFTAPFRYVSGADISNLRVDGDMSVKKTFASGLVAYAAGATTITNCRVSITIRGLRLGDGSHGGFVGYNTGSLVIEGCVFDGKMLGQKLQPTNCSGFVGFNETKDDFKGTVTLSKCLFAPTEVTLGIDKSFARSRSYDKGIVNLSDCYCTSSFGNDQEVLVYAIQKGDDILVDYNANGYTNYTVSNTKFADTALMFDDELYAASGSKVSLSPSYIGTDPNFAGFKASTGVFTEQEDGSYLLTMTSENTGITAVFIDADHRWKGEGTGKLKDPFIIDNTSRWNDFVAGISSGQGGYAVACLKLTNDITISTLVGTEDNAFSGHFDGNGHTLTLSGDAYGTESVPSEYSYIAPFLYIYNADIHDLNIAGNIYTNNQYAAGIVAFAIGDNSIKNCRASVAVNSTYSGEGIHGGLVAIVNQGNTAITDCAFNGSLKGSSTYNCGGFVGWTNDSKGASVSLTNCLFKPATVTFATSGGATFARGNNDNTKNITLSDCYYVTSFGTVQGEQAYADINASSQPLVEKTIAGVSFYAPGDLVTNITAVPTPNSATISWTGAADCTYQLRYRKAAQYFCGFENYPEDWTQIDADGDGKLWDFIYQDDIARTGMGTMISKSFDDGEMKALTPDNWLISPKITLGGTLKVWMRGADENSYKEHFAIYLSSNGEFFDNDGNLLEGVKELVPETEVTHDFKEYSADLSSYAGRTERIAIRHFNSTDNFFLIVDDFGVYEANTPWTTVENADAAGTKIEGLESNTLYEYQVVYRYKGNDYDMPAANLTTLVENPAPIDLTVTNIDTHSATLTWTGYSESYNVRYRPTATATPSNPEDASGDDSGDWTTTNTTNTSYELSGLQEGTSYTVQVQAVSGDKQSDWTNALFSTYNENLNLSDNGDNSAIIAKHHDRTCNVKLAGRTLYCDGSWNTLCLPFNLSEDDILESDSPLKDFTIMELSNGGSSKTGFNPETGTLTLDFVEAYSIQAGHAYIVKWGKEDDFYEDEHAKDIIEPVFKNVTIDNEDPADENTVATSQDGYVTFVGTYSPVGIYTSKNTNLYLGASNKIYYPSAKNFKIGSCRAYFKLNDPTINARAIVMNFPDDMVATDIKSTTTPSMTKEEWYDLLGRKLKGQPKKSGIYINNGKKVVIQ